MWDSQLTAAGTIFADFNQNAFWLHSFFQRQDGLFFVT
jgi:hypothetical protein